MKKKGRIKVAYSDAVLRGVELCRKGNWDEGLFCLRHVRDTAQDPSTIPAILWSYLGYGIARKEGRVIEGLEMCERAVIEEFYEPCHFLNLARCQLLAGNREGVAKSLDAGLRLDPTHSGLNNLKKIFGMRRPPVFSFLKRENPINHFFGKIRHRIKGPLEAEKSKKSDTKDPDKKNDKNKKSKLAIA